jgi:hypothetical protein
MFGFRFGLLVHMLIWVVAPQSMIFYWHAVLVGVMWGQSYARRRRNHDVRRAAERAEGAIQATATTSG